MSKPRPQAGSGLGRPRTAGPHAHEKLRLQAELAAQRRSERRIVLAVAVALVVLVVGGGIGLQAWRANRAPSVDPAPSVSTSPVKITDGEPIVLGPADAPVTVRLYEDFHCPHCADFEEEFGPVLTEAQTAGRAKVAFYPMAFIDEGSPRAANAVACAAEAGFGPAYYAGLFGNGTLAWTDAQLLDLADQVNGSVPADFRTCITSRAHADWVRSIAAAADAAGVTGTPTVFVDDQLVELNGLTPDKLRSLIETAAAS